jgi:hypothetical protein
LYLKGEGKSFLEYTVYLKGERKFLLEYTVYLKGEGKFHLEYTVYPSLFKYKCTQCTPERISLHPLNTNVHSVLQKGFPFTL